MAAHFSVDDITGKKVVVVANLKSRKMLGLESKGMILFAEDRDGAFRRVTPDSENGSTVA